MEAFPYELREALLTVKDVSLSLGGRTILRDVHLQIRDIVRPGRVQGQVVGLLGPSGIGKTQLFRILAGLSRPDTGHVLIGTDARPVRQGMVGVVAQTYPLFANRTILGNLVIAGKRSGLSSAKAREKALGLLLRFRLDEHAHKYPSQISGGQRQRVAIAQQFMCSESFLLMDEPFSGLDPLAAGAVCAMISEVASSNELNTFIIVTHDIASALEVADSIWLIGRDRDATGRVIPGARIQATYNLIDLGLAWHDGIATTPGFLSLLGEIRGRFKDL
jgi:NitT/TauT family transport system ATP-binding protein